MKDKLKQYINDVKGMDRIELVLDLLVDGKITKAQAVVLIANDKLIKTEKSTIDKVDPYWYDASNALKYVNPYQTTITTTTGTSTADSTLTFV
jgi:hypothetical protein